MTSLTHNRRFVFQGNLNRLLSDAKRFPPSSNPCQKCAQRKRACICSQITKGVGRTQVYEIEELSETKSILNELRDSLDDVDMEKWSVHTKLLDVTSLTGKHISEITVNVNGRNEAGVEFVTNAWIKMYEILEFYKILDLIAPNLKTSGGKISSFHISECPGAFIAALNHNIKVKNERAELHWLATSLNPYYEGNNHNEVLAEDILFRETYPNWIVGFDGSGNITKSGNIEYIWDHISRPSRHNKGKTPTLVDIVTADGSFNCQHDPNNQENLTASLKFSETICALGLLRVGGCFILKMFTMFEESSLSIMALLSLCFKRLEVYKPTFSKCSSSEVYVVCMEFNGITSILLSTLCKFVDLYARQSDSRSQKEKTAIIPKEWITSAFRAEFVECSKMFTQAQCRFLRTSMQQYGANLDENPLYKQKREFAKEFIKKYEIQGIKPESRLVKYMAYTNQVLTGKDTSSLFHVQKRAILDLKNRKEYKSDYDELQKERKRPRDALYITANETEANTHTESVNKIIDFAKRYKIELSKSDKKDIRISFLPSIVEDLLSDLRSQKYLRENWFSVGRISPSDFKMSFFVSNDILYDVTALRTYLNSALPLCTESDALLVGSSSGEALSDISLPPSAVAVELAMVIKKYSDIGKYKYYLEISGSQQFPAICIFKRHNVHGSLIHVQSKHTDSATTSIEYSGTYELQIILGGFVGDGTIDLCFEYNYDEMLKQSQPYKSLITELGDSPLKRSCDFIFCDVENFGSHHREVVHGEISTKHVLVAQLVQAMTCIADGGDLIIRMSTVYTRFTVGIIVVLSSVFQSVHLYQPEAVSPWTQKVYIVCQGYKEDTVCRHFTQCLWDALCLHKKSNVDVLQTLRPLYFTQIARELWNFNTTLLYNHFEDLVLHTKPPNVSNVQTICKRFLQDHNLLEIFYPQPLLDASNMQMPSVSKEEEEIKTLKRPLEEPDSPALTLSPVDENHSPIWSSDEE
ncbi:conserved hypothetical protein [Theileria equi strain WA]|uniref:Cap-specific mRNA (nucleoside-2'-O-)-methyltransferase 2 n=1 Tax=Theileria equi strain WA TaxID=1537102 RepID=L1LB52_THEEQ|nr:conserved hypothetical protein [Theileria equi strain WA]EKX72499.1 conserved hypothetical protein [Theileria equi strain WA]|eukprot:XP_004831951.1 conserved hypothetical protein [Theileria equi strain WA]